MKLRMLAAVFLGLSSVAAFAQEQPVDAPSARLQPATAPKEKGPIAAVSVGYLYLASETAPGTWQWHLHGFYGITQVNIKPWFGLIADFTESFNTSAGAHENVHSYLGGPIFTAKSTAKVSPFVFADAGVVRDSKNGTVTNSPIWAAGGGFTMKLNKHLGFLVVPGEYIQTWEVNSPYRTLNNFTARAGIVLPLMK